MEWHIPLNPVNDTSGGHDTTNCPASTGRWECAPDRGAVAVSVNGVPIYGVEEGPGGDAIALHFDYFVEEHPPLFTVVDSKSLRGQIEGAHSKNHYLKDAKSNFFLISIEELSPFMTLKFGNNLYNFKTSLLDSPTPKYSLAF